MKTYARFINAIDKVPTTTTQERNMKNVLIGLAIENIKKEFPKADVSYVVGKGFKVTNQD